MRLTLRLLGTEVLHLSNERDDDALEDRGDLASMPVGFSPQSGDQRWDKPIREEDPS